MISNDEINSVISALTTKAYSHTDISKAIELISAQQALITKFRTIVAHATPERTGQYFICGGSEISADGLPELVMICPAYGLDGFAVYHKASEYSAPEY